MNDENINDEEEIIKTEEEAKEEHGKKSGKSKKNDDTKQLRERIAELEGQLLRAVADYRNLEKRFEDEKKEFVKYANRELLLRLIPAFDTLFLAEKFKPHRIFTCWEGLNSTKRRRNF